MRCSIHSCLCGAGSVKTAMEPPHSPAVITTRRTSVSIVIVGVEPVGSSFCAFRNISVTALVSAGTSPLEWSSRPCPSFTMTPLTPSCLSLRRVDAGRARAGTRETPCGQRAGGRS